MSWQKTGSKKIRPSEGGRLFGKYAPRSDEIPRGRLRSVKTQLSHSPLPLGWGFSEGSGGNHFNGFQACSHGERISHIQECRKSQATKTIKMVPLISRPRGPQPK